MALFLRHRGIISGLTLVRTIVRRNAVLDSETDISDHRIKLWEIIFQAWLEPEHLEVPIVA